MSPLQIFVCILLVLVNLGFWYLGWKTSSKEEVNWKILLFAVAAYVVTMDKIYMCKDLIFEEKDMLYWIVTLSLFSIYVFVAIKAVKSNKDIN